MKNNSDLIIFITFLFLTLFQIKMNIMTDTNDNNQEINPLDSTRIVSGKMLRRDFIYDKRRDFLSINSIELLSKQIMDSFAKEAKSLYPQDGMYKITMDREKILKATYIGEY